VRPSSDGAQPVGDDLRQRACSEDAVSRDPHERDRDGRPLPPRLDPRAGRPPRQGSSGSRPAGGDSEGRTGGRSAVVARWVGALVAVAVLATSGWGWYLGRVAEASVQRTDAIPTDGNDQQVRAGEAMNLLLVGNDSRTDLTDAQLAELNAGTDSGHNTDTMILVHLPADGSKASFVSLPRDSYVEIPGYGWEKLNAAYAYGYADTPSDAPESERQAGGGQLLVQTVSHLTGLQIDHYAEVDLLGFFQLSSVVGGIEVNLCQPVDDRRWSGAFFAAGPQVISGADALKFVRQRHGLPRSDFDRIIRQQVFIAGVLRKMLSDEVLLDLGKQRELVDAAADALTVDQTLDLFQLAEQMQSVTTGDIQFQTIPYVGDDRDDAGRYVLRLEDEETLHAFFADLSADPAEEQPAPATTEPVAPSEIPVAVYNGSGTSGLAAGAKAALEAAGFPVTGTGNADSMDYDRTEIWHASGDEALAATLAASVPGAVPVLKDEVAAGTLDLVLGGDFNGVGQSVDTPAPVAPVTGEDRRTAADTTCIN
jgi:LCP family protein required for cell wall assembly